MGILYDSGNGFLWNGGRPSWEEGNNRFWMEAFCQTNYARNTSIRDFLIKTSDNLNTGALDAFHKRHIIPWDMVKSIVPIIFTWGVWRQSMAPIHVSDDEINMLVRLLEGLDKVKDCMDHGGASGAFLIRGIFLSNVQYTTNQIAPILEKYMIELFRSRNNVFVGPSRINCHLGSEWNFDHGIQELWNNQGELKEIFDNYRPVAELRGIHDIAWADLLGVYQGMLEVDQRWKQLLISGGTRIDLCTIL